uniref:Inducible T cell costimulator ligand n=1 Tax=Homo sapiens TaxID=9606 RepID=A0A096LPE5_HUMAN
MRLGSPGLLFLLFSSLRAEQLLGKRGQPLPEPSPDVTGRHAAGRLLPALVQRHPPGRAEVSLPGVEPIPGIPGGFER